MLEPLVKPTPVWAAALLPLLAAWAPPPAANDILVAGKAWSEVAAGPGGAPFLHAAVDIAAPPKVVWTVMNDCRYIRRLIASAIDCHVVSGDARTGSDVRETVTKGALFIPDVHNVYRSDYQPYSLIRFRKVGGNLKTEVGEWRLLPLNGGTGTRVIYENLVDMDILAPRSLVRESMRASTAKVMLNLQREAQSYNR